MNATLTEKKGKFYVILDYRDSNNKRKLKWVATGLDVKGNKRKAEEFMRETLEDFSKNMTYRQNKDNDILFADFIEDWLERSKANLQESSYGSYQLQVKAISKYFREKGIKLLDLKPIDISNYYRWMEKQGKSVQVREHFHVNIRKCLQSAVKADLIPSNPADKIERPKSPKHTAKFYDNRMLKELFDKIKGDRFEYIYKITALYGLRRSEMLGLKWKNIDFDKNMILISHAMVQTRINGKSVIIEKDRMKNQSSLRSLPLMPIVKDILLREKEKQEENKKNYGNLYNKQYEDLVCVDELGVRLKPDTVSGHFKRLLHNYRMPIINFHELRHSCASSLLAMGVPMKEIQAWLGHSTYETTANIYSHLDGTAKYNTASALVGMFGSQEDKYKQEEIKQDAVREQKIRDMERDNQLSQAMNEYWQNYPEKAPEGWENPIKDDQKEPENQVLEQIEDEDEEIAELERILAEKKLAKLKRKKDFEM